MEAVKVGKRGTIIVPSKLRKRYGIEEGTLVTTEARADGRPNSTCRCPARRKIHARAQGRVSSLHSHNGAGLPARAEGSEKTGCRS